MDIVWDQVPRWRKEANDRVGKKNRRAKQAKQGTGGISFLLNPPIG